MIFTLFLEIGISLVLQKRFGSRRMSKRENSLSKAAVKSMWHQYPFGSEPKEHAFIRLYIVAAHYYM